MGFAHLLNTTITYKAITGRDASGDPTLGTATTIDAYVDRERKAVPTSDGKEQMTTHVVTSDTEIPEACLLWVAPDAPDDAEGRRPLYVSRFQNPTNSAQTLWEAGL